MRRDGVRWHVTSYVSVPFNAGRGLMLLFPFLQIYDFLMFQYPSMRVVD